MKATADEDTVAAIRSGGAARDMALKRLYEAHLPMVIHFITQHGGSRLDAEDKFQDAVIVFFEHVRDGVYQGRSSIKTYLMAISRNLWFTEVKRRGLWEKYSTASMEEGLELPPTPTDLLLSRESLDALDALLGKIGDTCRKTLVWRFWESRPMKEVAKFLGFKNEQVAKNKQQSCLQKMRELIAADPAAAEILRGLA